MSGTWVDGARPEGHLAYPEVVEMVEVNVEISGWEGTLYFAEDDEGD